MAGRAGQRARKRAKAAQAAEVTSTQSPASAALVALLADCELLIELWTTKTHQGTDCAAQLREVVTKAAA